ncbi:glycoside hydrolase family 6 protein [Catellatospora tritici]|uniref:glycoside hydrolase family 6 protein n=1 Tax=Catellatospora tritici TaxID=2851566 RepID=UPI001C2D59C2|nr:glycoside hydrolase family 6 protein [Catellatospora tritici]MBV1856310.1 glycoside hydrolase family 6 protein [Catellatospora tritici]
MSSPRRRMLAAAVSAVSVVAAATAGLLLGASEASAGTLTGSFYRDPTSAVNQWLAANPNDSRASLISQRIGSQPQARWFASYNPSTIQSQVSSYVNAANSANRIPVLVAYMIPNRDCGGASAGGAPSYTAYRSWVDAFAGGLGSRTAVVILEPDSLALQTCLSATEKADRNSALSYAVGKLKQVNPSVKVYLDAGHSAWNSAADAASRLQAAGVANAAGFFSNVSNFHWTADEVNFGRNVLNSLGNGNLHQVIDVSRNGKGALGSEWCDPAGRGTGVAPTTATNEATVDAFLWVKPPGEADGCAAAAGTFVPDLAYSLAQNGVVTSPPPSPSASASPSRSASPSPSPSGSTPAGSCTVAYRVENQWDTGFTASVTLTNRGPAITTWTVTWSYAGNQQITNAWNTVLTQSGTAVTAKNVGYNGSVATNGSTSFGFQATYSGTNTSPTVFKLNGTTCS